MLNAIFVAQLLLASSSSPDSPERMRFGAEVGSESADVMTAFFADIKEIDIAMQQPDISFLEPIDFPSFTLPAELSFEADETEPAAQPSGADPMRGDPSQTQEFSRLRGLYLRQIAARVHRAWERPATLLLGVTDASCVARIAQDESGAVCFQIAFWRAPAEWVV